MGLLSWPGAEHPCAPWKGFVWTLLPSLVHRGAVHGALHGTWSIEAQLGLYLLLGAFLLLTGEEGELRSAA